MHNSDKLNSKITRDGSTHRCVMKGGDSDPFLVSHSFQLSSDFITFIDTNHREGMDTLFTLRKTAPSTTQMGMHFFIKKSFMKEMLINLFMKKKLAKILEASCTRLNDYCKKLIEEGRQHSAAILLQPAAALGVGP